MPRVDWDLLTRYLAGTSSPAEREWVERMTAAHPEIAHVVTATREIAGDGDAAVSDERRAAALAAVKADGGAGAAERAATPPRFVLAPRPRSFVGIAATIALLAAGGATAGWLALRRPATPANERPAFSVVTTAPGQRLSLRLSDGTLVSLAPLTTLRTPADYGRRARAVELEGEAVFTVPHDSTRPFAVRTPRAVATDLGTRFAVRAYADDLMTDVVVAEGQVAVRPAASGPSAPADSVILGRGERARVADGAALEFTRGVSLDDYFGWAEGKLVFRGTPLREAMRRLGRWYDIEIRLVPDTIGDRRLSASVENEPAVDVLHTVAVSLDLRLSRAGRVFTLSAR